MKTKNNLEASSTFKLLLEDLKKRGLVYEDSEFPAGRSSLIRDWNHESVSDKVEEWSKYEWKRSKDIK